MNAPSVRFELDEIVARLDGYQVSNVTRDASSKALTTYRCGGPFAILVRADREEDLSAIADARRGHPDVDVLVVGRGSNLLVADAGFAGVAVVLGGEFERIEIDAERAHVIAGGAVALPVLARRAAVEGVGGLEFFVGIPGSVGGAVRMNAGGHGAETKDVLVAARVVSLDTGSETDRETADLQLGYRRSAVSGREVVVGATLQGHRDAPEVCGARIDEIVAWRREHQPGGQNAGSVFTNPPDDSAGRLIDACGLKGLRIGGAVVSAKHANFFVADPGASADDVRSLVREVQKRVAAQTGITLHPELHFVGFDDTAEGAS